MKQGLAKFLRGLADTLDPLPPALDDTEAGVEYIAPVPKPAKSGELVIPYKDRLAREVTLPQYVPDTFTHCNLFVRTVCPWFGWNKFHGRELDQAGEIATYLAKGDPLWRELTDMKDAQRWSMQDRLIVAAQANTDKPDGAKWTATGHVCIVMPTKVDEMVFSGKWDKEVPLVANVGKVNFVGRGLNYAFKKEPRLYLYLGSA